jgi:hypothetical protein
VALARIGVIESCAPVKPECVNEKSYVEGLASYGGRVSVRIREGVGEALTGKRQAG